MPPACGATTKSAAGILLSSLVSVLQNMDGFPNTSGKNCKVYLNVCTVYIKEAYSLYFIQETSGEVACSYGGEILSKRISFPANQLEHGSMTRASYPCWRYGACFGG